jgi:hypothetical protein
MVVDTDSFMDIYLPVIVRGYNSIGNLLGGQCLVLTYSLLQVASCFFTTNKGKVLLLSILWNPKLLHKTSWGVGEPHSMNVGVDTFTFLYLHR